MYKNEMYSVESCSGQLGSHSHLAPVHLTTKRHPETFQSIPDKKTWDMNIHYK